jgi:hypothetical protein
MTCIFLTCISDEFCIGRQVFTAIGRDKSRPYGFKIAATLCLIVKPRIRLTAQQRNQARNFFAHLEARHNHV